MDVETAQAIEDLAVRIDQLEAAVHDGFSSVRGEIVTLREDLREELRSDLDSNWTRTQALFESLRGDVQMLAGRAADLVPRRSSQ